jgi:chemotaxis protein histidine kinase CheA/ActR/RegA family two-component response regulator
VSRDDVRPSPDVEVDFDEDELAMLRQLFRDEAREGLAQITELAHAAGDAPPTTDGLTEMMRVTHTLKGAAGTVGVSVVVDLSHRLESLLAAIRQTPSRWRARGGEHLVEIVDALVAVLDSATSASAPDAGGASAAEVDHVRTLIDGFGTITAARAETGPVPWPDDGRSDGVPEAVMAGDTDATVGLAPGDRSGVLGEPTVATERGSLLRVEAARVDALMSSAGELLFDRTRIERRVQFLRTLAHDIEATRAALRQELTASRGIPEVAARLAPIEHQLATQGSQLEQLSATLLDEVEALRRTIGNVQQGLTRIRMQTARSLFLHLARAARAVGRAASVRVELRTEGEDTEFDKSLAEQLVDPLIQLLRNAVAHGLEPEAERTRLGKPASGTITLRARQEAGLLLLEFADDGRGIDPEKLRQRFITTGRWSRARAQLASDEELLHALFEPGVSSRDDVDELSGRGIGLDLVRGAIARLGGEVRVTSTPGAGTTFTLRLPLSMSVADAVLFKVDGQVYAVPGVHVLETTTVGASDSHGSYRGEPVPLVRLERVLADGGAGGDERARRPASVVAYAGKVFVCSFDKLIGPREIVLRPLGPLLAPLPLYAGATISASGKVQLILDSAQLARRAYPDSADLDLDPARMVGPSTPAGRALVVDDSRAIREAMSSILVRDGWIVDVAEHGGRALELARQVPYDLVVTDLEMPVMPGFELIEQLRALPAQTAARVVIITSRATADNRARAHQLGALGVIAKPVTRRKLIDVLSPGAPPPIVVSRAPTPGR